ncbi:hypothetical protein GDO86_013433 [Hymenochirus boettgeri]|uniref:ALMS motif domain-containing protein n=1 Tax=Hymenochirus boettgeri TaxID=247094 RepID=A0A8T2IRE6_9PIPI|nr:hypothetical protein GDO86_013433 [Hymenochirus boettgeri]
MIDANETEENKSFFFRPFVIPQPNSYHEMQSTANNNSVSTNREFTVLPVKLKIQTPLDKTTERANKNSTTRKQRQAEKKGFSSITITARKMNPPANHLKMETTRVPAMLMCRSNYAVDNGLVSSLELDQQQRPINKRDCYNQSSPVCGTFDLCQEIRYNTIYRINVSINKHSNGYEVNRVGALFISNISAVVGHLSPAAISYVDKSLSLCVGKVGTLNQQMYKSAISFKIKKHYPPRRKGIHREKVTNLSTTDGVTALVLANKEGQPPSLDNNLETANNINLEYISKTKDLTKAHKGYHFNCKDGTEYMSEKTNGKFRKPLKVNSCLSTFKERSKRTTFNYIYGKQTPNAMEILYKENISPNGLKGHYSFENSQCDGTKNILLHLPEPVFQMKHLNKSNYTKPEIMSLQKALEHHRPDFISNSQERVQKLELMAQRRKIQQIPLSENSISSPVQKLPEKASYSRKKLFTVPLPLSDNLFKPKERTISEKEMQQRSKRIYNSLPEVKRKKEEEEKKMITQSNRMRAELFKKKLLNQILQRNAD